LSIEDILVMKENNCGDYMVERRQLLVLAGAAAALYLMLRGRGAVGGQPPSGGGGITGRFTITFTSINDTFARFAGAWLDNDPGPGFWQIGQDNLGVISPPEVSRTVDLPVTAGRHTLHVRVSSPPEYRWRICVRADGVDLGCREGNYAAFSFTA